MTLNCIIVDDEPVARKVLEEYIADISFLQLTGRAENPVKAASLLESNKIDLMFLDINMPRMSGLEFLRSAAQLPMTIMTTAYSEYAVEGFELNVIDYLVKPFSAERFLKACTKAKEYYELKNASKQNSAAIIPAADYFFVKCDGRIEKVAYADLYYAEAMLNYVVLHTETRKMIVYLTIKSIEEQLPANIFLKIHKSTIINKTKIKSIDGNEIDLGKAKVIISQNLQSNVIKEIVQERMLKR
ncbi:LytR/AlgR family response regulator transcription factor [Chitinophagaceae bacterium MMS25-I14]